MLILCSMKLQNDVWSLRSGNQGLQNLIMHDIRYHRKCLVIPNLTPPSNMFVQGILHHATGAHKKPAVFFLPSKLRVGGSQPEVQLPSPLSSRKFTVRPLKHDGWKSSLPETKSSPLKKGHIKKKIHLPTIDFSGDMFVSGRLAP